LLRWRHPDRGIIGAGAFIETLAESSIASEVGKWTIRTSCQRASAWRAIGLQLGRLSVNLFPSQLHDASLLKDTEDILRQTGLPPEALELEITENIALNHEDESGPLQKLHEIGVKFAFDDFGTGYASLSNLARFPVSRIKIDRSFVRNITDRAQDAAIVSSLITMAHNLGLGVIAEGVETDAQAALLLNEKCEEAQGFLYAKPLQADEFERYLMTNPFALSAEGTVINQPNRSDVDQKHKRHPSRRKVWRRA
jgi:EAL domain-containing protein (putative c-di-GMP-specific phosphodiesterase class I)